VPIDGGAPKPFSDSNGAVITHFASSNRGGVIAYSELMFSGGCFSEDSLIFSTSDVLGGIAASPPLPEFTDQAAETFVHVRGLSWAVDGATLTFGLERFTCESPGDENPQVEKQTVYVWDTRAGNSTEPIIHAIADGSFPTWVQ
jgi:hypothetical protein